MLGAAGQKQPAGRFRLLDKDGIASVGDYIMPGGYWLAWWVGGARVRLGSGF